MRGAILVALSCAAAFTARAADNGSPYELYWPVDAPVAGGSAALWLGSELYLGSLVDPSCPCDERGINAFDRPFAGRYSHGAAIASDVVLASALALPFALDAIDVSRAGAPWSGYGTDAVVIGEAIAVNALFTQVVKIATARPRPLVYGLAPGDPELQAARNYTSFYSGHTSFSFAAGMSYASTYALRHPNDPWRFGVYGAAAAFGTAAGVLRVAAGKHYPSDVIVGAAVGTAIGLLVPWLHEKSSASGTPLAAALAPRRRGFMLALGGAI